MLGMLQAHEDKIPLKAKGIEKILLPSGEC